MQASSIIKDEFVSDDVHNATSSNDLKHRKLRKDRLAVFERPQSCPGLANKGKPEILKEDAATDQRRGSLRVTVCSMTAEDDMRVTVLGCSKTPKELERARRHHLITGSLPTYKDVSQDLPNSSCEKPTRYAMSTTDTRPDSAFQACLARTGKDDRPSWLRFYLEVNFRDKRRRILMTWHKNKIHLLEGCRGAYLHSIPQSHNAMPRTASAPATTHSAIVSSSEFARPSSSPAPPGTIWTTITYRGSSKLQRLGRCDSLQTHPTQPMSPNFPTPPVSSDVLHSASSINRSSSAPTTSSYSTAAERRAWMQRSTSLTSGSVSSAGATNRGVLSVGQRVQRLAQRTSLQTITSSVASSFQTRRGSTTSVFAHESSAATTYRESSEMSARKLGRSLQKHRTQPTSPKRVLTSIDPTRRASSDVLQSTSSINRSPTALQTPPYSSAAERRAWMQRSTSLTSVAVKSAPTSAVATSRGALPEGQRVQLLARRSSLQTMTSSVTSNLQIRRRSPSSALTPQSRPVVSGGSAFDSENASRQVARNKLQTTLRSSKRPEPASIDMGANSLCVLTLFAVITNCLHVLWISLHMSISLLIAPAKLLYGVCCLSSPPWSTDSAPRERTLGVPQNVRQEVALNFRSSRKQSTADMWAMEALSLDFDF